MGKRFFLLIVFILLLVPILMAGCGSDETAEPDPEEAAVESDDETTEIEEVAEYYQWGAAIDFSKGGNAPLYQSKGWSGAEDDFTWTDGNEASLHFLVDDIKGGLILTATFDTFIPEQIDSQTIVIRANGQEIERITITEWGVKGYKIHIPGESIVDENFVLSFETPDATSPYEHGISDDSRMLGIAVRTLSIIEYEYHLGTVLSFARGGNAPVYQDEGWSNAEEYFTWTNDKMATLSIPLGELDEIEDLKLNMNFSAHLVEGLLVKQRVYLLVNGQRIAEWVLTEGGPMDYEVTIPSELVEPALEIAFELPDAVSPADLGVSNDRRTLAIALHTLSINR